MDQTRTHTLVPLSPAKRDGTSAMEQSAWECSGSAMETRTVAMEVTSGSVGENFFIICVPPYVL